MEIIFLAASAGVLWLYLFNATLCYAVVGGGYSILVTYMIFSRILKARKLKGRVEPVNDFVTEARVAPFRRAKELGSIQVQS